jgi:hypothetical protein
VFDALLESLLRRNLSGANVPDLQEGYKARNKLFGARHDESLAL